MKKFIIIVVVLLLSISGCTKPDIVANAETTDSPSIKSSEQASIQPSASPTINPADAHEVGLLYADPEIDMFLMVDSPGWTYTKQLYEGEAYFYPKDEDPATSPNGFAISSREKTDATIESIWTKQIITLQSNLKDFKWEKKETINVGRYTGYRYHFTGSGITGDYFFWETDSRLYICSFTSDTKKYANNLTILKDSLRSFKVLSEMKK